MLEADFEMNKLLLHHDIEQFSGPCGREFHNLKHAQTDKSLMHLPGNGKCDIAVKKAHKLVFSFPIVFRLSFFEPCICFRLGGCTGRNS